MEYGRIIRDAWGITWRHPFLWIFGLFAGGAAGSSFKLQGGGRNGGAAPWGSAPGGIGPFGPGMDARAADVLRWAAEHAGLIAGAVGLVLLVGLALLAISLVAQGGLAGATADFAAGRESTPGRAWRTGLHLFWRYAGLWLLLAATVIVVMALVTSFAALVYALTSVVDRAAWVIAPAVVVGFVLVLAGIAAAVVVSIVVPYAQRAIAVQDVGPIAALRDGWRVLRANPGSSLLVWLIDVGLSIGSTLVITMAMVFTVLVLALPALGLWGAFAWTAPTIAYLVIAGVVAFGILLTLSSVANTFSWSYWTLAYLRLRGQPTPDVTPA
jgi:hypothetical protein